MNKDEIKKAFAICCGVQDCTGCPILDMEKQNGRGCKFNLFTSVIDTVSEQEKEIERLKAEFKQLETNAEILARGVRDLNHENYELTEKIKQAQIDVLNKVKDIVFDYLGVKNIKEAEALSLLDSTLTYDVVTCGIDEIIKEVENDK